MKFKIILFALVPIFLLLAYLYLNTEYPKSISLGKINIGALDKQQTFQFTCPLNNHINFSFAFDCRRTKVKNIASKLDFHIYIYDQNNKIIFSHYDFEKNMTIGNWNKPKVSLIFLGHDKVLKKKLSKGEKYKITIIIKNSSDEKIYTHFYLNYLDTKYNSL